MTDERAELVAAVMCCIVAFACFMVAFVMDTAAVEYPWVTW